MLNPLKQVIINWQGVKNYGSCLDNPNQTLFDLYFFTLFFISITKKELCPSISWINRGGRAEPCYCTANITGMDLATKANAWSVQETSKNVRKSFSFDKLMKHLALVVYA
jgi:hypothetical protein